MRKRISYNANNPKQNSGKRTNFSTNSNKLGVKKNNFSSKSEEKTNLNKPYYTEYKNKREESSLNKPYNSSSKKIDLKSRNRNEEPSLNKSYHTESKNKKENQGYKKSYDSSEKTYKSLNQKFNKDSKTQKPSLYKSNQQKNQLSLNKNINEAKSIFDDIRLNKFIANAGICSRREADELIQNGLVEVNGKVITEMGYKVLKTDLVRFDDRILRPEKPTYVLLNKPKGFISTTQDEKMRKTVLDLVAKATPYRLFPVGRLDRPTTGLLLLTNDGELTKKLTHPSHGVKKVYQVVLDQKLSHEHFELIKHEGVHLFEGIAKVDSISFIEGRPKNEIGVEIHIGWNRVIRRIFEKLGYQVVGLDRVLFAGLTKKSLKRGDWRHLTELEINNLKML